jgi:hypothetical protein
LSGQISHHNILDNYIIHFGIRRYIAFILLVLCFNLSSAQVLAPKKASAFTVKQVHSGHSLTDPLFYPHWPGQYVNLIAFQNSLQAWQLADVMVGKSTIPGSSIKWRWGESNWNWSSRCKT